MKNELEKKRKNDYLSSWAIFKEDLINKWIDMPIQNRNRSFQQGQVITCELGENIGYEICKSRPALVISDDRYSGGGQLVIIPLTKNTSKDIKTHYKLLKSKYSFLQFDSCVKTEQIKSVSSIRIKRVLGKIEDEDLKRVKVRLKTLFNI